MEATQTAAGDTDSPRNQSDDFTALDANNFIRSQDYGCLLITNTNNAEPIQTAFITVNRTYFRINQFGATQRDRISRVKRHTMSTALENARNNGHDTQLAAYQQSTIDITDDIDYIRDNYNTDTNNDTNEKTPTATPDNNEIADDITNAALPDDATTEIDPSSTRPEDQTHTGATDGLTLNSAQADDRDDDNW